MDGLRWVAYVQGSLNIRLVLLKLSVDVHADYSSA